MQRHRSISIFCACLEFNASVLEWICQPTLYIDEHTSIDTSALLEEEKIRHCWIKTLKQLLSNKLQHIPSKDHLTPSSTSLPLETQSTPTEVSTSPRTKT